MKAAHVVVATGDAGAARAARVLSWLLREKGYTVSAAETEDALTTLLRDHPTDLVLVAGTSPHERLVRAVREVDVSESVPLIVAGVSDSAGRDALLAGADDWVGAPLRVTEVMGRVASRLGGEGGGAGGADSRALRRALRRREEELARAQADIATSRQLVEILNEVTSELTASEIYRVLARRVARALDLRHCSIVLAAPGEAIGTVVAAYDDPSITDLQVEIARYPELAMALATGRPVLVDDVLEHAMFAEVRTLWQRERRTPPIRSVVAIPFTLDRRQSGVFFLRTERGDRLLTTEDVEFAEVVIRAAVAAIRRAHALDSSRADNRRLEELATTDALTRILNRRALLERLSVEVDRARRFHSQLSMLMVDLDHFKQVNDVRGHLAGDEILRQLASLLTASVRTIDVVARYGGEEFVVILPETSTEGATVFAERLRERVEAHPFEAGGEPGFHLTCSIGVATFPAPRVASPEDLFARADEALYRAKSGGRNQVRA